MGFEEIAIAEGFGQTSLPRGLFRSSGFLFKRGIAGLFLKYESIWARFVVQLLL